MDEISDLADRVTVCRAAEIDAVERDLSDTFRGYLALARMLAEEELRRAVALHTAALVAEMPPDTVGP